MKFNFKKNEKKLTISSTSILIGTLLISSCSSFTKGGTTENSESNLSDNTNTSYSDVTSADITQTEPTKEYNKKYNFMWDERGTKEFSNYVKKKLGIGLRTYILYYGFTDELNKVYTEYIDLTYNINDGPYDFSCSNKFYIDMTFICPDKQKYRNYGSFRTRFLWDEMITNNTFRNKLILSYLINNNIPLGSRISIESFESLDKDYIHAGMQYDLEYFDKYPNFGNFDKSYRYSSGELIGALQQLNCSLCYIYYTEGLKDQDLFADPELCEILNGNLKKFYGENAIQIGKVPTKEQYMAIFGEEPLDLSYIPGAVMQVPQETMASPVSYIDYNNYNVYYNPNYNMYSEEEKGRSR